MRQHRPFPTCGLAPVAIVGLLLTAGGSASAPAPVYGKPRLRHVLRAHRECAQSIALRPDGKVLASCSSSENEVKLWDVRTGKRLAALAHPETVNAVAFHPTGKLLASAGVDGKARLWDSHAGKLVATLPCGAILVCVAFSPGGGTLATATVDGKVRLWDVRTHKLRSTLEDDGYASPLTFSPDGKTLASAVAGVGGDRIRLWDLSAGKIRARLVGHRSAVYGLSFSPAGKLLASASRDHTMRDHTIKLWDPAAGKCLATLGDKGGEIMAVAFRPDGKTLAAGHGPSLHLWDVARRGHLLRLEGDRRLAERVARVVAERAAWDAVAAGTRVVYSPEKTSVRTFLSLAFSADGRTLAASDSLGLIELWSLPAEVEPR